MSRLNKAPTLEAISGATKIALVEQVDTRPVRSNMQAEAEVGGAAPWVIGGWKRLFDVTLALILVIPVLVVTLLAAIVSAVAFRAWPLFTQLRVGQGGKTFTVLKLRSLPTSWPSDVGKHELQEHGLPKVSRLIRGSHVDELPQVFNVLLGHMSIVGPRPMLREVLDLLPEGTEELRNQARPGITGVWQISTMGGFPLHHCPDLDVAYVENATFTTDLFVLWRTATGHFGAEPPAPTELQARLVSVYRL